MAEKTVKAVTRSKKASGHISAAKANMADDQEQDAPDDIEQDTNVIDYDFMGSREDYAESRTVACRERIRRQMEEDMQAFLASGGAIRKIAPNVLADPPRKPSTAYGSRPI